MSSENPDGNAVEMMPQPHGGSLKRGGTISPGRPANAIRRRLRGSFAQRIDTLKDIADNGPNAEKLKALDLMAKYGLGTTKEITVDNVRERLEATLSVIRETLPADMAEALILKMEPVWR